LKYLIKTFFYFLSATPQAWNVAELELEEEEIGQNQTSSCFGEKRNVPSGSAKYKSATVF
jgi:hypothetical protein